MEKRTFDFKKSLLLIIVAIIGYWAINNLTTVGNIFSTILNILFPFVLGGALAFILNIPMTFFEKKLLKTKKKKQRNKKLVRIISIVFAIIVIVLVLGLIIRLIVPELIDIVKLLITNIPYYVDEITKLIEQYASEIPDFNAMVQEQNIDLEKIANEIINQIPTLVTSSISIVSSLVSGVVTTFIAIVFAVYILMDKEKLKTQTSKLLYAYLKKETADKIVSVGRVSKDTFKSFFTVQCLEATILGTLCIIGMLILRIPYAIPIGVLIGVTALIPVVGAFIGVIVGAILIVAVDPFKVITFVIFVLILQQVEGNLIYPRVVGNSIGLPGMWVLLGVSVGGSLGGIVGMLLGVPLVCIIYTLLRKDVNKKLEKKIVKSDMENNEI